MRRSGRRPDSSSDDEDIDDREPSGPPRHRRGPHRETPEPVRAWNSGKGGDPGDGSETSESGSVFHRPKRPVFFRARDSLYFEPLVALALIVLLLVALWAYTQNWPPMYVVESESMQHGTVDQVGLINTGDLVLAQKIDPNQVTTYVVGLQSGYTTYGEFGDVILYHPNGQTAPAPVIHRALVYLQYDAPGIFTIPSIQSLPCGSQAGAVYSISSTASGCGWNHVSGSLTLHHIGWQSVNVTIGFAGIGRHSGFVTMGDNNFDAGQGIPDQPALSDLVDPGWVVGVARGMLPWFGAVKLLLEGNASEVPTQSWQFMGITLIAIALIGLGIHYALRGRGGGDQGSDEVEDDDSGEAGRPSRWRSVAFWRGRRDEGDEEEDDDEASDDRDAGAAPRPRGGRPRPEVRRGRSHRRRQDDDS